METMMAGGVGGSCLIIAGHPLDTVKVRLQSISLVGKQMPYSGTVDCIIKTVSKEGFSGLFKGISAPLAVATPVYALCFIGNEIGKRIFTTEENYKNLELLPIAAAGATAGLFCSPVMGPQERIKCIMQVERSTKYKGSSILSCGKELYRLGGIRNLYCGYCVTTLRVTLTSALYFSSYEYFKRKLPLNDCNDTSIIRTMIAGGLAGMSNLFSLPLDVLKSKIQSAPYGFYPGGALSIAKEIIRHEGWQSLFRGLGPTLLRSFPANAACFLGYETTLQFFRWCRRKSNY